MYFKIKICYKFILNPFNEGTLINLYLKFDFVSFINLLKLQAHNLKRNTLLYDLFIQFSKVNYDFINKFKIGTKFISDRCLPEREKNIFKNRNVIIYSK